MKEILPRALIGFFVFASVIGCLRDTNADWRSEMDVIGEVFKMIEEEYLYPIDLKQCRYDMLRELSRRTSPVARTENQAKKEAENEFVCLDRFSRFADPFQAHSLGIQAAAERNIEISGHVGGVGMELSWENDMVVVVAPIDDMPAAKAGVQAGDSIVAVRQVNETKPLPVKDLRSVVKRIRGAPNTKVFITFERSGVLLPEIELTRTDVKIDPITKKELPNGIGYVRLKNFNQRSADELDKALASFRNNGKNPKVILDLRDNPGGLVNESIEILYLFSKNLSDVMLTVETRNKKEDQTYTIGNQQHAFFDPETHDTRSPGEYSNYTIVLLIDKGSALASEIVAGTMKDWGRAVVGETSFGKGAGQTMKNLSDGSIFLLTTFQFLVGNSKTKIHEVGVHPTHEVKDNRANIDEKGENGEIMPPEVIYKKKNKAFRENTATEHDAQFQKAIELLKK